MTEDQIIAFLIFALVAAITPGPSNLLVMAAGSSAGFIGGLRCLAGVAVGMGLLMSMGRLGLGGFTAAWPQLLVAMQYLGSIFLLWLAWQVTTAPASGEILARQLIRETADPTDEAFSPSRFSL